MSANIKASVDGTQAIIGVGGVDQMTVSNAGVVTANSFVGLNGSSVTATGSTTARTLANRFADVVNVKDFGAVGDGITDDTAAINRALYQLYCREVNPAIRRSLFFPAGVYLVTGTINVPPYATLQGEGPRNSIIQMAAASAATYVVQTSDSLQQTGADIGTNGATPPTSITIENMCFQSVDPMNIAFINRASECIFNQVQFVGPLTTANLTVDTDNTACVRFDSSDALEQINTFAE